MLTLVLLALSSTAVAAAASSQDCSLNGQWAGSECACDPPWTEAAWRGKTPGAEKEGGKIGCEKIGSFSKRTPKHEPTAVSTAPPCPACSRSRPVGSRGSVPIGARHGFTRLDRNRGFGPLIAASGGRGRSTGGS